MILYQYHFFDKDIRYDIISNFWPRYRYDIISSKKRYFQCLLHGHQNFGVTLKHKLG
jgi:hypothetical protein